MSIITFTITYTYIMMETWTFRYYFSKSFCLIHYFMSDVYDLGHWFQKLEKKSLGEFLSTKCNSG